MNQKINEYRKQLILEAADEYFTKFGYSGVQVDKMAKDLGIGVGTIYSIFGSKEGLFYGWLYALITKAHNELKEEFEIIENPLLKCEAFAKFKLTYYEENKTIFRDYMQNQFFLKDASRGKENPMKRVYLLVAQTIEELIKKCGNIENPLTKDCYHLAYLLDGIVDSYIECYSEENKEVNLVTKTKDVVRIFLNAIGMSDYEYEI